MIKLRILNETGHTTLTLTASEVIEQIDSHPTHWAFINGDLVAREEISGLNWDEVTSVDLTPAIVGGCL
jgi:sulfur transfer complex TusBCD TusB component (DsrH family)